MKTIKFLLVSLLVMLGTTAFAQGVVVHKTDGTTEVIHDVDSVVYETSAIGYYSFNATSKAEIKNLTEDDFIKLTESTSDITCNKTCYPVFLTEGTTAPTIYCNSKTFGLGDPITLNDNEKLTGGPKTIGEKSYKVWYISTPTEETDTDFVRIIFK